MSTINAIDIRQSKRAEETAAAVAASEYPDATAAEVAEALDLSNSVVRERLLEAVDEGLLRVSRMAGPAKLYETTEVYDAQ